MLTQAAVPGSIESSIIVPVAKNSSTFTFNNFRLVALTLVATKSLKKVGSPNYKLCGSRHSGSSTVCVPPGQISAFTIQPVKLIVKLGDYGVSTPAAIGFPYRETTGGEDGKKTVSAELAVSTGTP